ncbi:MAG: GntR family transcriptional regulator [Ignavibacteriales bacterium]
MAGTDIELISQQGYSLTQKIFNILQNRILNGVYSDGERLCELKLTKELNISRTPVREAIFQLEQEGLVKIIPNKGAIVIGITLEDIKDIYSIRIQVEGLAARLCAERITAREIERFEEIMDLMELYTNKKDYEKLLGIDTQFHSMIFNSSKSRPLIQVLGMLHMYVLRARKASFQKPGRAEKALQEHMEIYRAILDKKPEMAENLATKHVKNAEQNLMENL